MELSKISLIIGLLLSLANIANWIYKYFNGAYKLKKSNEDLHKDVDLNKKDIKSVSDKINELTAMINALFEISKIQTRYSIVNACTDAFEKGYVEQYHLQSIEDMYTMYTDVLHGNSYVSTLMKRLRKLEIRTGE